MTDREYLKKMVTLTEDLERIASAEPFDKKEWECAIDEYHRVNLVWCHNRRKFSCWTRWIIWFLLGVLCWVVWRICC